MEGIVLFSLSAGYHFAVGKFHWSSLKYFAKASLDRGFGHRTWALRCRPVAACGCPFNLALTYDWRPESIHRQTRTPPCMRNIRYTHYTHLPPRNFSSTVLLMPAFISGNYKGYICLLLRLSLGPRPKCRSLRLDSWQYKAGLVIFRLSVVVDSFLIVGSRLRVRGM